MVFTGGNTAQETIMVESLNGNQETAEVEVLYDPERIAILDMACDPDVIFIGGRLLRRGKLSLPL